MSVDKISTNYKEYNKKICRLGNGVYGICLAVCILCGTILKLRFEVTNILLIILGMLYAVVMSKIQGTHDTLRNRNIIICSAITKIIVMFGVLFESALWGTDGFEHQYDSYYYLLFIVLFIEQMIEVKQFIKYNESLRIRKYILITTMVIFVLFTILDNSVWGFLLIIPMLTIFIQCDDIKGLKVLGVSSIITVTIASYTQIHFSIVSSGVDVSLFGLMSRILNNSLSDWCKSAIFRYLIIVVLMWFYLLAVIRVTKVVKKINERKIALIEDEERKISGLVKKVVIVDKDVKEKTEYIVEDVNTLSKAIEENKENLIELLEDNYKNMEGIEEQSKLSSNISKLINDVVENVENVIETTKNSLEVLDGSKNDFKKLKINSDRMYESNKEAIDVINEFVKDVRNVKKITEGIEYISDETNLLSMNASIKSTRAGVNGEGFAVVAKEIHSLAEDTSVLTENINSIINELEKSAYAVQNEIKEVVNQIVNKQVTLDDSIDEFRIMADYMTSLSKDIDSISSKVNNVTEFKDEIESHIELLKKSNDTVKEHTKEAEELNNQSKVKVDNTYDIMKQLKIEASSLEDVCR